MSYEDRMDTINNILSKDLDLEGFGSSSSSSSSSSVLELIESGQIVAYFGINISYYYLFLLIIL